MAGVEIPCDAESPAVLKVKQGGCESRGWTSGVFVVGEVSLSHEKLSIYLVLMITLIPLWVY